VDDVFSAADENENGRVIFSASWSTFIPIFRQLNNIILTWYFNIK